LRSSGLSSELATIPVTVPQRELFVTQCLPMPPQALVSERVVRNVEHGQAVVRNPFQEPTIPEPHKLTAYGLRLAGVEYVDHLRGYRNNVCTALPCSSRWDSSLLPRRPPLNRESRSDGSDAALPGAPRAAFARRASATGKRPRPRPTSG